MDPQACLQRIIDATRRILDEPGQDDVGSESYREYTTAFEELGEWLDKGGFPPVITGPVFGTSPVSVGYPGMQLGSPPHYEQRPIRHLRSHYKERERDGKYALMVTDHNDMECREWQFVKYRHNGSVINEWKFPTAPDTKDQQCSQHSGNVS